MIASLVFEFEPLEEGIVKGAGGEKVHGLLLNLVEGINEETSEILHRSDDRKPFTLSHIRGAEQKDGNIVLELGKIYNFRITILSSDILDPTYRTFLLPVVKKKVLRVSTILIKPKRFLLPGKDNHTDVANSDYQKLFNESFPSSEITLRFLSPTSFRSRGEQKVFPEPTLVFSSLLKRWNAFSSVKFPKELEDEFSKIRVTRYSTRTELVEFSNYKIIGFKGMCSYELPKTISDEAKKQVSTLADFAFFAGVGYKTTMGMGQTVRVKFNKDQEVTRNENL